MKRIVTILLAVMMITASFSACKGSDTSDATQASQAAVTSAATSDQKTNSDPQTATTVSGNTNTSDVTTTANVTSDGALDATDYFSDRDMKQTADTSDAKTYTLSDNNDITITSAGVYVISGTASNASVIVDAGDDHKVQIVFNGASITNTSTPAVYVKNADKVFITTADGSTNNLTVSGAFTADGSTNTDAVIFSKDDITLNGLGTLNITSSDNGISGKDDVKITGGTINITSTSDAVEANESIRIADGAVTISSEKDGLHAENDEDDKVGFIYICGGTLNITAAADAVQATTVAQVDGGTLTLNAREGIEGTFVQINEGTIDISASDDGINASDKSSGYQTTIEINGGKLTVNMGQGDTDAIDSNGNLYVNGGEINITGQSPFDYDGEGKLNGGTVIFNGTELTELTNQMMGGGMGGPGGMGGGMAAPGNMNGGMNGFGR